MFTGIIEEIGKVERIKQSGGGIRIFVSAPRSAAELCVNDSVSINGVCQTVISKDGNIFEVEAVEETLKKTTLGILKGGGEVNLELPMRLNERLGGHLVLGHVDAVGQITEIEKRESSWMYTVDVPRQFTKYVVPVGSIAIDGVSLTVAELEGSRIRVSIIPHTMENTVFKHYRKNDKVNLELDVIGKYVERLLHPGRDQTEGKQGLDEGSLRQSGY